MTLILLVLGFLPLGVGLLFERFILSYPPDQVPPYFILGLLFLLLWGAVAFFAAGWERQRLRVVGLLNAPALLFLLLNGVQILLLKTFWPNVLGLWSQDFFLPVLPVAGRIARFLPTAFSPFAAAFLLMAGASLAGAEARSRFF